MSVEDKMEIMDVINLYGLAVDTQHWALFDRVFTPDVDAYYSDPAHWTDREIFKRDFAAWHDPFDGTQHTMTNHQIRVEGDRAWSMTYGHWRLIRKGLDGGDFWEGNGWYDDMLIKTADGWRISKRVCHIIWWGGNSQVNETIPDVKFELGSTALRKEADAGRVAYVKALK